MIPYHLRKTADVIACRGDELTVQLVCPCGCERFRIYENTDTPEQALRLIAVQCEKCGAEAVVFDNRFHGCDGAVCGTEIPPDIQPPMKQKFAKKNPARRVRVTLRCEIPEEALADLAGSGADAALLSECFTSIGIAGEAAPGKYRCFFSAETA